LQLRGLLAAVRSCLLVAIDQLLQSGTEFSNLPLLVGELEFELNDFLARVFRRLDLLLVGRNRLNFNG
jgi:hypothetical protein